MEPESLEGNWLVMDSLTGRNTFKTGTETVSADHFSQFIIILSQEKELFHRGQKFSATLQGLFPESLEAAGMFFSGYRMTKRPEIDYFFQAPPEYPHG